VLSLFSKTIFSNFTWCPARPTIKKLKTINSKYTEIPAEPIQRSQAKSETSTSLFYFSDHCTGDIA